MHEVLVNRLGGLSLLRKSVVRLTDRPDMTLDVYRGRKTTNQSINNHHTWLICIYMIAAAVLHYYVTLTYMSQLIDFGVCHYFLDKILVLMDTFGTR